MKFKYFNDCENTKAAIKKRYRELAKQYHPDLCKDGDGAIMAEINSEYDFAYETILHGGTLGRCIPEEKHSTAMLSNFSVHLIIRDKNRGHGFVSYYPEFLYGFFGKRKVYRQYRTADDDKCVGVKSGFRVCEVISNENSIFDVFDSYEGEQEIRVLMDREAKPADISDIFELIRENRDPFDIRYHNFSPLVFNKTHARDASLIGIPTINIYHTKTYGDVVFIHRETTTGVAVGLFKIEDQLVTTKFMLRHLGPVDDSDKEQLTVLDIICIHRFGYTFDDALGKLDISMPDICYALKFDSVKDRVTDWPLDPTLARYVRLGILKVYRHNHLMIGHFDFDKLIWAIIKQNIDLEDIDECQDWIDEQYNKCLDKYESDVKHDRIKLNI